MGKVYTLEEVSRHNHAKDCWLLIRGKVYDVTEFLEDHPGGDDVLIALTAKDATLDFEDVGHSTTAQSMMDDYYVGDIDAAIIPAKRIPSQRIFGGIDMGCVNTNLVEACEDDIIVGSDGGLLDSWPSRFLQVADSMTAKPLLGCKFSEPELQSELSSFPFNVTEGPDGFPLIHFPPYNSNIVCSPTQLLTDALSSIKDKNNVSDCCVGIPAYFTYQQRKEVLAAATMARLIPRGLLHDTTATALMYRFSEHYIAKAGEVLNLAFIDVGHLSMQVSIVELKKDQLKVLSHAHDKSLGGRAFDQVLFEHALAELGIDTSQMSLSSLVELHLSNEHNSLYGLFCSCNVLKEELSSNNQAELMHGTKRVVVNRAEFEKLSYGLLIKVKELLQKALNEARLSVRDVHSVQIVGKGANIPAIQDIIKDFFEKEPRFNMRECKPIAIGCFIQCAMLSFTPKLPKFQIIDILPYSIGLLWKPENDTSLEQLVVFPKGSPFPGVKDVTLPEPGIFSLDLVSINADDSHRLSKISTYKLFAPGDNSLAEVKIKVRLDLHGMAYFVSATVGGLDVSTFEFPYDECQTAYRDKLQKAEQELADVSTQLNVERIERENALKERDYAFKQVEELHKKVSEYSSHVVNFTEFTGSEIKEATNNFDKSLIIGEGGFGSVYKGFLRHTVVAIKILNPESYPGDIEIEFNQEVDILTKIRHPNLVLLIGASLEARALVYEFLPNDSLDAYLTNRKDSSRKLSWQDRIRIASEICSALIFLHSIGKHGIAHGDLKPENILLDSNFACKIIDFGISRELQLTEKTKTPLHLTQYPKYTPAYADPEFFASSNLTPQSDTYSFGIILLQLVTNRGPRMIIDFVEEVLETGKLDKLVGVSTCEWPIERAQKLASLGLRCCDPRRRNRPDLKDVWSCINSLKPDAGP